MREGDVKRASEQRGAREAPCTPEYKSRALQIIDNHMIYDLTNDLRIK